MFARPVQGYASIRAYAQSHSGYRMGIETKRGTRIGWTETVFQPKADGTCEVSSHAIIHFPRSSLAALSMVPADLAKSLTIELWSEIAIGADDALQSFEIRTNSGGLTASASGTVEGELLKVVVNLAGTQYRKDIPIAKDDILASGLLPLGALPNLREGQTWRIKMLDPLTFKFDTATATVKRKTRIRLRGGWYLVYEVELAHGNTIARSWVTESGDVLREEEAGIVLIREPLPHERTSPAQTGLTTEPAHR